MAKKTNVPCQHCGRLPTAKVALQGVEGMILMHRITRVRGYYCRECGLQAKDQLNALSLKRGWFSIGGILGIGMLRFTNSIHGKRLLKLDAPRAVAPAAPAAADVARA